MKRKFRIILACGVVAALLAGCSSNENINVELKEHITMGNKYLDELEYEQALTEYMAAVDIDKENKEAITGIETVCMNYTDALLEDDATLEECEKLLETLEKNYATTLSENIQNKIVEVEKIIEVKKSEKVVVEQTGKDEQRRQWLEKLYVLLLENEEAALEYMANHTVESSYSPEGDTENGIVVEYWEDGYFFGEKINGSYQSTGIAYQAIFKNNGRITYEKYDGEWKDGKPNGMGEYTCVYGAGVEENYSCIDKFVVSGTFTNGYYDGEIEIVRYQDIYNMLDWWPDGMYEEMKYSCVMGEVIADSVTQKSRFCIPANGYEVPVEERDYEWTDWGDWKEVEILSSGDTSTSHALVVMYNDHFIENKYFLDEGRGVFGSVFHYPQNYQ